MIRMQHDLSTIKSRLFAVSRLPGLQIVFWVSLLGYWLLLARLFPLGRLAEGPILQGDYSYHYAQASEICNLIRQQHTSWGYSASFFAGYPLGAGSNLGAKAWASFVCLLNQAGLPEAVGFNLFVFLWLFLLPLIFYLASRLLALSPLSAMLSAVVSIAAWWGGDAYSLYIDFGLVSFLAGALLALLSLAAFVRFMAASARLRVDINPSTQKLFPGWPPVGGQVGAFWLLWVGGIALCGWLHALSLVFILPGLAILYLPFWRRINWRVHLAIWIGAGVALAAQWPWFSILVFTRSWSSVQGSGPGYFVSSGWRLFSEQILGRTPLAILHRLLFVGAGVGLVAWWRQGQRRLVLLFAVIPVGLLLLGYFGPVFNLPALDTLQPARNLPVAYLWLSIPAAAGGLALYYFVRQGAYPSFLRRGIFLALVVLNLWPVLPGIGERFLAAKPLIQSPSSGAQELAAWISANTTPGGRILFEDSLLWRYKNQLTAGYLAYVTEREFIGGPFPWGGPADFLDSEPFGLPIETISAAQMKQYFDLYNIHWVIVHSQASVAYFDRLVDLVEPSVQWEFGRAYIVIDPGDYFIAGSGEVSFRGGRIVLSELHGDEVVLSYHWMPGLHSQPAATLEQALVAPDPFGFIKIVNPPSHLTLWAGP